MTRIAVLVSGGGTNLQALIDADLRGGTLAAVISSAPDAYALERAAKAISEGFRAQDYVCRIGGDEFAVIMVHTDPDSAEEIRMKVEFINAALTGEDKGIPEVHVSCGVAYGQLIKDFDKLFIEADAALYRVKNNGGAGCEVCL